MTTDIGARPSFDIALDFLPPNRVVLQYALPGSINAMRHITQVGNEAPPEVLEAFAWLTNGLIERLPTPARPLGARLGWPRRRSAAPAIQVADVTLIVQDHSSHPCPGIALTYDEPATFSRRRHQVRWAAAELADQERSAVGQLCAYAQRLVSADWASRLVRPH